MMERYFKFTVLLNVLCMRVEATVISQTNMKVIPDSIDITEPRLFFVTEDLGLVQVSSSGPPVIIQLQHGERAIAVDYHHPRNLLFWTTSGAGLYSCSLRQPTNAKLIHDEKKWWPIALSVDYLGDRLYILDGRTNSLRLLGIDGKHSIVLTVGSRNYRPTHIELDPRLGFILLLDDCSRYGHILRMNMDGSNSQIIDPPSFKTENQTGKITLDRIQKRILVSSRIQKKIFSIDYGGKVLNTVLESQSGALSLGVTRTEFFWVNANYYSQGKTFVDGSVYKCNYTEAGSCRNDSIRALYESYPGNRVKLLKVVEPASQNREAWSNHDSGAHDCDQLRLGGYCACETGWRLDNDLKSCRRIDEFLIYENDGIIRSVCLEGQAIAKCQAIEPFKATLRLHKSERTGFVYDSTTRKLYYGGLESIYSVDINTAVSTQLLYQRNVFFGPMTLDWMTKNLYYTEIEWRGNVTFYILKAMSVRTDDPNRVQDSTTLLWEFGKIHSLVVHPERGYLFVSAVYNKAKKYRLVRLNTDMRNLTILPALGEATFLTLDYLEDRLYVINANGSTISSSDLHGGKVIKVADTSRILNITGFLVYESLIYVKNLTGLYRFNKTKGEYLGKFNLFPYDLNMSMNLRLHSPKVFTAESNRNPCARDNGHCDNFCFAVPQPGDNSTVLKKICKCFDGIKCNLKS